MIPQYDWDKYAMTSNEISKIPYSQIRPVVFNTMSRTFDKVLFVDLFRYIQPLLEKYRGKLAVCGGFFTTNVEDMSHYRCLDADIFFHGCSENEANDMLKDCVIDMVSQYSTDAGTGPYGRLFVDGEHFYSTIRIERKLHITNVKILLWKADSDRVIETLNEGKEPGDRWLRRCITYQFIHRVYPNLGSVLGGFDLGPCMVAYDGYDIWATEIGAWSHINKRFVIDISRRSTTFATRIKKYIRRGYIAIMPGLRHRALVEAHDNSKAIRISIFMDENDIEFKCPGGHITNYDGEEQGREDTCSLGIEGHIEKEYIEMLDFRIPIAKYKDTGLWVNNVNGIPTKTLQKEYFSASEPISVPNISDYSDGHGTTLKRVEYENRTALLHRFRESVTAVITNDSLVNLSRDELAVAYDDMISNPNIPYGKIVVDQSDGMSQFLQRKYAEHSDKFGPKQIAKYIARQKRGYSSELDAILNDLNRRCKNNLIEMREVLAGRINWITRNPGRQWTASINPSVESATNYYGKYYTRVTIGLDSKVESVLRLAKNYQSGNVWYKMPREIFNHIISISLSE